MEEVVMEAATAVVEVEAREVMVEVVGTAVGGEGG